MTRDEILNMPAGYEIRKLLGEKVMGWNQQKKWWVGASSVICPVLAWKPDEDIDAAFAVVKEMRAKNYWFGCQVLSSISEAWFTFDGLVVSKERASYQDLPIAICRAALLAVMDTE